MTGERQLQLVDEQATEAFGRALAAADQVDDGSLRGGIVHLRGELGAGKTTLVRGLLRGLGYAGAVKSPTYTLVEPYEFACFSVYHFDLYRLADPEEFAYLGVERYFARGNLCLIEWPEHGAGFLPPADLSVTLSGRGSGRRLALQAHTALGRILASASDDHEICS